MSGGIFSHSMFFFLSAMYGTCGLFSSIKIVKDWNWYRKENLKMWAACHLPPAHHLPETCHLPTYIISSYPHQTLPADLQTLTSGSLQVLILVKAANLLSLSQNISRSRAVCSVFPRPSWRTLFKTSRPPSPRTSTASCPTSTTPPHLSTSPSPVTQRILRISPPVKDFQAV